MAISLMKNSKTSQKIKFEYIAPSASNVFVVGSFNNWNEKANPLKKNLSGEWSTTLLLAPGRYEYRFIIDGVWECDQKSVECVPNAFGTWNCVLSVK